MINLIFILHSCDFYVDECLLCSYSLRKSVCVGERERKAGYERVRGQVLVAVPAWVRVLSLSMTL